MESKTKLYLYLGRRDKKGMKVIAVFNGTATTSKIEDVRSLGLSAEMTERLQSIVYENRMYHELWIEPAESFADLSNRLTKRGYTSLPLASTPSSEFHQGLSIDTKRLPQRKVMTRKKD